MAVTPEELAKQLQGVHFMLAMMTGVAIWQIQDTEALMLAKALINVGEQYNIDLLGGKSFAIVQLLAVAGMVYVPRMYTLQQMRRQDAEAQNENIDPHGNASPDGTDGRRSAGVFDFSAARGQ